MSVTVNHIGNIIHHCGAIEFLINQQIKMHSKDSLLTEEIIKLPLHRRADILKRLLERERSDLGAEYISNLAAEIKKLGNERNIVAHNPLISKNEDMTDTKILFHKNGEDCEYSVEEIKGVMQLSAAVLNKMASLNNWTAENPKKS